MTANFKFESTENLDALLALQPNRPILVSEFWPGWFDHWFEPIHNTLNIEGTNLFSMFYGKISATYLDCNFLLHWTFVNFCFQISHKYSTLFSITMEVWIFTCFTVVPTLALWMEPTILTIMPEMDFHLYRKTKLYFLFMLLMLLVMVCIKLF